MERATRVKQISNNDIQDPWDISELSRHTPKNKDADEVDNPINTNGVKLPFKITEDPPETGNLENERKPLWVRTLSFEFPAFFRITAVRRYGRAQVKRENEANTEQFVNFPYQLLFIVLITMRVCLKMTIYQILSEPNL